ncbi:S-adenosyl-L-methionine-dependent methyltransferase [Mucor mucedo]|uniref:S-adenosyl-L-methionine-dependent methyltransferase n=1 Tax=Mucor mucedo TaxID=29922 RepID=UPI00221FB9C0|nr:S-adenosyl-L-methionine-dependent methyltransferase [Mucor mucedo]KAI7890654.1 S-adenosyl-L-methionine-dependent methyltransferase [Mucor mucedo]
MNFFEEERQTSDDVVRGTNDDATVSRCSAVTLGYLQDPFVHLFVKKPVRRSPIINRGTFIRSYAIDSLVSQFLAMEGPKKQIVALGAGFDTRYFNIKAGNLDKENEKLSSHLSKYFEVDFPEITMKKAMLIKKRKELSCLLDDLDQVKIERGGMDLKSTSYCLLGADLRKWSDIAHQLVEAGLDLAAPTLFLSECVFIYLAPEDTNTILKWITDYMKNTLFALYEQIHPDDAFGKMMIRNLKSRNIDLKGIHAFPDLIHQEKRFLDLGWQHAKAVDINTIHDKYLDRKEIARMARLEILDELEEWHLLSAHYCVAWAFKSENYETEFSKVQLQPQSPIPINK